MSILFTKKNIGTVEVKNRFVHSATYEAMAGPSGEVTGELIGRYRKLARGGVGLIIPGFIYVHPFGKAAPLQTGAHSDEMVPGLRDLAGAIHEGGSKVFFQLVHAGTQTSRKLAGRTPMGPSDTRRHPISLSKPDKMTEEDIAAVIRSFGEAARRSAEAGADGVQLHAAHGYLISQFLSPFFNDRDDDWGGSDVNRFRILKEIVLEVRRNLPGTMPVIVKINACDFVPEDGITPRLAGTYCGWLADVGINGVEVSCGLGVYSFMSTMRGEVPVEEMILNYPQDMKPLARSVLEGVKGLYEPTEGYNLEGARAIKPAVGDIPVILVGGMRSKAFMEQAIGGGIPDFISMSRPFIREPHLVRRFKEGKTEAASCASCNKCFAAVGNKMPLKCYNTSLSPADSLQ